MPLPHNLTERAMANIIPTPSQTVGPFFKHGLKWDSAGAVLNQAADGRITVTGIVTDGADQPIPDAFLEVWQADASGNISRTAVLEDGSAAFARAATDDTGRFVIDTVLPGRTTLTDGSEQAPYLHITIFARGLLRHLFTRCYFEGSAGLETDPVLKALGARGDTLIARKTGAGAYAWNVVMQGDEKSETVFFDI